MLELNLPQVIALDREEGQQITVIIKPAKAKKGRQGKGNLVVDKTVDDENEVLLVLNGTCFQETGGCCLFVYKRNQGSLSFFSLIKRNKWRVIV